MENTKTLNALDEFAKAKPIEIPRELDEYLDFVASTGDPVYQWSLVKILFRQKLLNVILEFFESCPMVDVPLSPNLDAFNFETVKKRLLERYDTFSGVPFTIQRIAELLTAPKKQYSRLDKYLRALEKNIWVVSTRETICRDIAAAADENNLVNGALPNMTHANNVNPPPERLKRQSEAFDSEDDDDDLADSEPNHSGSGDQYPYEPETENVGEIAGDTDQIEVSVSVDQTDSVPSPNQPYESAEVHEPLPTEPDSCTSSEALDETVVEQVQPITSDEVVSSGEENVLVVEPGPDEILEDESTIPQITEEKEKTENVTVTEITEESNSSALSEEIAGVPLIVEPPSSEVSSSCDDAKQDRVDLKRKIEEVIGEEEEVPNKKIECEAPVTIAACEPLEEESVPEEFAQVAQNSCTVSAPIEAEIIDKVVEPAESMSEPVQVEECSAPVEGEMESTAIDEKAEMIVEESDLSMDVDETSVQSPMVQEDAGEPMEETDQELGSI